MTDTPRTEAGRRLLAHIPYDYPPLGDAVLAIEAEAAAGPREVYVRGHCPGCIGTIDIGVLDQHQPCPGIEAEAAAGPRDEGLDAERLARALAEVYGFGWTVIDGEPDHDAMADAAAVLDKYAALAKASE